MTRDDWIHGAFAAAILVAFLPKLILADSTLYRDWLTEETLLYLGSGTKLVFLFLGFVFASRCALSFETGNPVRPAWSLLAVGLLTYLVGQSVLSVYALVLSRPAPFPSLADPFFLLAMALWLVSLALFVRTYAEAGYLGAGAGRIAFTSVAALALFVLVSLGLLRPVLESPAPFGEKALNLVYPISDMLLLIPVLLMVRMAYRLRGGRLGRIWVALLVGFLFMAVGDILFAYFATLGNDRLEPLVDVMFACSYIAVSWGASSQHRLLNS